MKKNVRVLTECAVMLAAATALSFVKIQAPLGGGITACSMLPLVIICRRHGTFTGLLTAFAHSVLQLIFGLGNVQYATSFLMAMGIAVLDYLAAYTVIGLSSVYSDEIHAKSTKLLAGVMLSLGLRFACHFLSGWIIWEALWPNDYHIISALWSFFYNGCYMIPEMILTSLAAICLNEKTSLLDRKKGL